MTDPLVSVIVPCRNEETSIRQTVEAILGQRSDAGEAFEKWGELIVVDDESSDRTPEILAELRQACPALQVLRNEQRRGLAGSYNRAISAARAEILLTCHADCRLLGEDYLRKMLKHFSDPSVAAVTGKPAVPDYAKLSFVEKTYILTHLMDVQDEPPMVREINFAEGRCDGFRKKALEAVGLYNQTTRISGEDQILAIEFRRRGYRILQDTSLRYSLSCGASQNSVRRIIARHVVLAQGQAFITARFGLNTARLAETSPNRRRRRRLRMAQILAVSLLPPLIVGLALWRPSALLLLLPLALLLRLAYLAFEGDQRFSAGELLKMMPASLACDAAYGFGFYRGLWLTWLGRSV